MKKVKSYTILNVETVGRIDNRKLKAIKREVSKLLIEKEAL